MNQYTLLLTEFFTWNDSLGCHLVSSPLPGCHLGHHSNGIFNREAPSGSSWLWPFLSFSYLLKSFTVMRNTAQVFCRLALNWDLSDVFSWRDWAYRFGEEDLEDKVLLYDQHQSSLLTWLRSPAEGVWVRFLPCGCSPSSPFWAVCSLGISHWEAHVWEQLCSSTMAYIH